MDTPDKNQISATTLSKFEDSPVFNYINSLSPIEPVKSIHPATSFNLLSFASPSSVFASPQIGSIRGSRFLRKSHRSPDSLKAGSPLSGNENKPSEGDSEIVQPSDKCAEQVGCLTSESSATKVLPEPLNGSLELDFELPKTMKYGYGTPVSNKVSCDIIETSREPETYGVSSFLQCNKDELGETCHFEEKSNLRKILRIEQSEDIEACNWDSLISGFSAVVNSDSPIVENTSEEQDQKTGEPGMVSYISTVLHLPQDNYNHVEKKASASPNASYRKSEMREPVTQMEEIGDWEDTDRTPDVLSSTLPNKLVVSDSEAEDNKGERCGQPSCKHKIRRRCLFNDMVGGHKKQAAYESNGSSSIRLQSDCEAACVEKLLVPSKRQSGYSLPGVGLHLNALASTSKNGKIVKCKTLFSVRQLVNMQGSLSSVESLTSGQNLNEFSMLNSIEKCSVPCDSEVKATENALQTCAGFDGEDIDHSNPKRKRCKPEPAEESNACKRCNCKRSKCLKLYCDCFAAGLYCVEPCSCLDCFNKPIYEDTVMETRRQIESRNPLAFVPKVIRSIDSATEFGDEINKTPASARHKRGCNCKKSSCLKKYCECFQSGVGCSISCRCEGCKNAFGRKDGAEETEYEAAESEGCEKNESDTNLISNVVKKGEEEYPDILKIPSEFSRGKRSGSSLFAFGSSPKLQTSIKLTASDLFYRSTFETNLQLIPEDETPMLPEGQSSPTSGVQSASPNSKRILPQHEMGSSTSRVRTRRLTLRSALSFPSVTTPREQ